MKNIRYINAGAGSGKTHTLSHLLSDSLLGQKGRTKIDSSQVILTTFTKAAASEFREKSRAALIEAGSPDVAAALEGAAIGTVHSVCEQFIRKYWCSLGLSSQMKVLSDDDRDFYVNQSIAKLPTSAEIATFNDFCRSFDMRNRDGEKNDLDFEFWKNYVKKVIEKLTTYSDIKDLKESKVQSEAEIDAIYTGGSPVGKELKDFLDKLYSAVEPLKIDPKKGTPVASIVKVMDDITKAKRNITAATTIYKIYGWIADDPKTLAGTQKIRKSFDGMYPGFDYYAFQCKLESWMVSSDYGTKLKNVVAIVFRMAEKWQQEYIKYKADNQILDFDDLEQYFLQILTQPKYKAEQEEIKASYKLLMVDEFQDSNPVQLQIFDALSDLIADGGGETFWVGDPKQSIYGFRGSDTSLIKSTTDRFELEQDNPHASLLKKTPLQKSWRSRPELVDAANEIFVKAFERELPEDDVKLPDKARPYKELTGPCMLRWDSANPIGNTKTGKPEDLAQKIYDILYVNKWDVIRKKRDDETDAQYEKTKCVKIEPKDVAVLCRSRAEVKKVVAAFRDAGLPVSATEPDILDWAEVQLVLALLRFVVDNGDMGARADLAHLLGEVPVETILKDRYAYLYPAPAVDEWKSSEDLFKNLAQISKRIAGLSVSDILSQLILELGLYEYAQKWDYTDARRQNLGLLQRLAIQYEDHCVQLGLSSSVVGFVDYLTNYDSELKNEDTTSNTVKVMTFHKSKGLEWNVVCLFSLNKEVSNEDEIARKEFSGITVSTNAKGERFIHLFPTVFGSVKSLPDAIMNKIKRTALYGECFNRVIGEERRLLYVGFTRARDYLVTFSKKDAPLKWIADCGAGSGDITVGSDGFSTEWSYGKSSYENISGFIAGVAATSSKPSSSTWEIKGEEENKPMFINPSKAKTDVSKVKMTEVFKGGKMSESIKEEDKCGTCIHNIFAAFDPAKAHEENVIMAGRIISGLGVASQLPDADSIICSAEQFFDFLKKNYPGENLALRETPFLLKMDSAQAAALGFEAGQIIRGEIDLVWVTGDKKCVLVDYKSYHGNPNINTPDAEAQKHYSGYAPQLLAYKTALEADGYAVEDVLVYYHVQGRAIRFEF